MSDPWSKDPPPKKRTRKESIEHWIATHPNAEVQATRKAEHEAVTCPAPLQGFSLHHHYWDSEGDCWCVYTSNEPPTAWYERPCL